MNRPKVLCLTGGPCGGKSTAMPAIRDSFLQAGYGVMVVPEAATILLHAGLPIRGAKTLDEAVDAQVQIAELQIFLEDQFQYALVEHDGPSVLLCDRGLLDNRAYMTDEAWALVQRRIKMQERRMLRRYDGVLHFISTAYSPDYVQNAVRSETPVEAMALDLRIQEAWNPHGNVAMVHRQLKFETKIQQAIQAAHRLLS